MTPKPSWVDGRVDTLVAALRELGIADRGIANISFTDIPQPWLRDLAKRWARWRLSTGQVAETVALSVMAVRSPPPSGCPGSAP